MKLSMNSKIIAALALISLPLSLKAADGSGTASATIIAPITITPVLDLAFGKMSANNGGSVVINAVTAARSVASGDSVLVNLGSTTTAATFDIAGEGNSGFDITLPAAPVDITHTNGIDTMSVGSFTSNPSTSSALVGGAKTISVGGTLNIGASQLPGSYSGNFVVTVEYN